MQAVAKKLKGKVCGVCLAQLLRYAEGCVQLGLDYLKQKVDTTLKDTLAAFKAACIFSPLKVQLFSRRKVHSMQPTASDIDRLCAFPFFTKEFIELLKKELPLYLSKCADTSENVCRHK